MTPPTPPSPPPLDPVRRDQEAFDRTEPKRRALRVEQIPRCTLEPTFAVSRALQIADRLDRFRPELATLVKFDLDHLDGLRDLAHALMFAHVEVLRRIERRGAVPALAREGYRCRALMMAYLDVLVRKAKEPPKLAARLRLGSGYLDLTEDLNVLVLELESRPGALGEYAPVTHEDAAHASRIAHELLLRVSGPEVDLTRAALLDARRRLGALLLRSQAQLRRAMEYLRFDEGDAAELVPPLHVPGGRPRRRAPRPAPPAPPPERFEPPPDEDPFAGG